MYFAYTQRTGISNPAGGACLASFWGLDEEVLWLGHWYVRRDFTRKETYFSLLQWDSDTSTW